MPIFVIFVFAAVVFGAGALFSPTLPTVQPRIGLASALVLAIVLVGAVGWSALVGWDTLIIDYLWFALIVGVFLAGTFSAGMFRAEAEGKKETGWPGPRELAFLLTVSIVFGVIALTLPVPLGGTAQGFGYLSLTLKLGGGLTTLAPFHPEINTVYSPAFPILVAYLAHQLHAGIQNIELALGAVFAVLFVWLAYDLGSEIDPEGSRRTGIAVAVCTLLGTGLLTADLDSHYTALMALCFTVAFLTFAVRWLNHSKRTDFLAAVVTLACVPLSQPDMAIILSIGYVPWLLTIWLAKPRPTLLRWLALAIGIPGLAIVLSAPWLSKIAPLLGSALGSPAVPRLDNLLVMSVYHGGLIVALAFGGAIIAFRRRSPVDLLMLGWLLLVIDFSSLGLLHNLLPVTFIAFANPFSIAWHGPIIPYAYLGATALLWLIERAGRAQLELRIKAVSLPIMNVIAALAVLILAFKGQAVTLSRLTPLHIEGASASAADVRAMEWIAQHTPKDALILNHPKEGDWATVISGHDAVYFSSAPYATSTDRAGIRQDALRPFWYARPTGDLLAKWHIRYVLVPQIVSDPAAIDSMFRWRPPSPELASIPPLADLPYLKMVFDEDGARVYEVQLWRILPTF